MNWVVLVSGLEIPYMSVFSNIKDAVVPVLHCTVIEIQSCVYFLWSVSGYLL